MENIKTVYQTDLEGFYLEETLAHRDPRNESRWLIPAGAVEEAPPEIQEGKAARYLEGKWQLVSKVEEAEETEETETEDKTETEEVEEAETLSIQQEVKPLKKRAKKK